MTLQIDFLTEYTSSNFQLKNNILTNPSKMPHDKKYPILFLSDLFLYLTSKVNFIGSAADPLYIFKLLPSSSFPTHARLVVLAIHNPLEGKPWTDQLLQVESNQSVRLFVGKCVEQQS